MTGRMLDNIAAGKVTAPLEGEEETKEEDPFAKFLSILQSSKYQKNLTFTLYKILKHALLKKYFNIC